MANIIWFLIGGMVILVFVTIALAIAFKYIRIVTENLLNVPFPLDHPQTSSIVSQDVEFTGPDGTVFHGKFILAPNGSRKTVIFCHEFGSDQNSWVKYLSFLPQNGFNVFTFDFRKGKEAGGFHRNGFSPKQWPTKKELRDLLSALEYLRKRNDVDSDQLGIFGVSKGAGLALCAAAKSKNIRAVVTDGASPMEATIKDYIDKWASIYIPELALKMLPDIALRWLAYWSIRFASLKLHSRILFTEKQIQKAKQAILLIHGEEDHYIRAAHARFLYDRAGGDKELWVVPKAVHNDSVLEDPKQYEERILNFYEKHLEEKVSVQ
jgi:uncharacterized protein